LTLDERGRRSPVRGFDLGGSGLDCSSYALDLLASGGGGCFLVGFGGGLA